MSVIYLHVIEVRDMAWLFGGAFLGAAGMKGVAGVVLLAFLFHACWLVPHHADCLRLADRSGLSPSRWMVIGAVAMLWGVLALFDWAPTQRYYIGFW